MWNARVREQLKNGLDQFFFPALFQTSSLPLPPPYNIAAQPTCVFYPFKMLGEGKVKTLSSGPLKIVLKRPFKIANAHLDSVQNLYTRVKLDDGTHGYGEVAVWERRRLAG
jgi:hypothetical protein